MKEYDYVKLLAEKEKYAKNGVHKDMTGWICDARIIDGCRLVCFDNCDLNDYPIISIEIDDMEVIWSAPAKDIGTEVVLSSENYVKYGLYKGTRGKIIAKDEKLGQWIVRFEKQNTVQQTEDRAVDESDIAIF